jgi:hypothetical protein
MIVIVAGGFSDYSGDLISRTTSFTSTLSPMAEESKGIAVDADEFAWDWFTE